MWNIQHSYYRMLLLKRLTFKETFTLWGGLRLGRLDGTDIYYKDVTDAVLEMGTPLPPNARVASIHLNIIKPLLTQLIAGQRVTYARRLLAARAVLVAEGYTHIAITGPLLVTLRIKDRLVEIAAVYTHPALSIPIAFATWIAAPCARPIGVAFQHKNTKKPGLSHIEISASFRKYVLFRF